MSKSFKLLIAFAHSFHLHLCCCQIILEKSAIRILIFELNMSGQAFRGTSADQDSRFGKADQKLLAKMQKEGRFSAALNVKINMSKINASWLEQWVETRTAELLEREDDIVSAMILNLLRPDNSDADRIVWTDKDAKRIQVEVTGFLGKQSGQFMGELWLLLASAQATPGGVPAPAALMPKTEVKKETQAIKTPEIPAPVSAPAPFVPVVPTHHAAGAGAASSDTPSAASTSACVQAAPAGPPRKRSRFADVVEEEEAGNAPAV